LFLVVIASRRVRAKRGPMTGPAKQSIYPLAARWIASSLRSSQRRGNYRTFARGGFFVSSTAIAEISGFMK
jgi:hypothetical protein